MSDRFPIRNGLKQGDALSPMLFNFALEYTIRRVQVNQDGLKPNGTHQLLAYADDVNILGGNIHTLKENAEALVAATREIGLEVNADKTKYMFMSRDQNAGRIHSVRIDNSTFERVEEFKYLGTNLTNQNSIAEEIKSRLKSGNACYHSMQNILSSRLQIHTYVSKEISSYVTCLIISYLMSTQVCTKNAWFFSSISKRFHVPFIETFSARLYCVLASLCSSPVSPCRALRFI